MDRITRVGVDVAVLPTDQKARTTRQMTEVVVLPTDVEARLSRQVVEVVVRSHAAGGGDDNYPRVSIF